MRKVQLVPDAEQRVGEVQRTMEQIATFRQTMPVLAHSDIAAARHEGHRR